MTVSGRYNRLACVMTLLGITSYATAAGTPVLALIAVPLVVAAWRLTSGPRKLLLPRIAVNVLLLGVLGWALVRASSGRVDVDAIAELVLLIQLVKLGDRRSARDDAQILSMAVFLGIAAMLTSNDFWVGIQILAMLPVTAATVMLFQLHSGLERAAQAARDAGGAGTPAAEAGQRLVPALRTITVLSVAGACATAALVFVLMPRGIGENVFGRWGGLRGSPVSGFTDRVRLGSTSGIISQSPTIVLTMQVQASTGMSLGGTETIHYLRGAVLDRYDGGVWARGESRGPVRPSVHELGPGSDVPDAAISLSEGASTTVDQVITLRSLGTSESYLFAAWRPIRVEFRERGRLVVDPETRTLRGAARDPGRFEYVVSSSAVDQRSQAPTVRTPTASHSARVRELAEQVLRDAEIDPDPATRSIEDDARAARVIQDHLRTTYQYTLETEVVPEGEDPIEWFLFRRQAGHCEDFAAAMAMMCRGIGIHTRLVAGYVAAEYNGTADQYVVRESNAHAWVEAELGSGRWRRFDPSPSDDVARQHRPSLGLAGRFRQWLDAVEFAWNKSIVSFDESTRARVIGREGGRTGALIGRVDAFLERVRAGGVRGARDAVMLGAVVFIGAAFLGSTLLWGAKLWRGRRPRPWRRAGRRDPALAARLSQVKFYDRLLKVLKRRGLAKPAWRPPLEHARAIDQTDRELGAAVRSLAGLYYEVRFGGASLRESERREAEEAVRRLRA